MRGRYAGVAVRLAIAVVLLASGLLAALPAPGTPVTSPPAASALRAKSNPGRANRSHDTRTKGDKKQRGADKTPPDLDAERIAAARTRSVAALQCGDLIEIRVGNRTYCTHGDDPPLPTGGTGRDARGAEVSDAAAASSVLCIDDGQSGPRVQMVYVHRGDRESRFTQLLPTLRRLAGEMDLIFAESGRKTGSPLHLRMVTDANCQVDIRQLTASPAAVSSFANLIARMADAGYDRLDRKYLMMVDDRVFCGVGSYYGGNFADDPRTEVHEFTGYARIDTPCWDAGTMAHELAHTFGAVQYSAPHTSRGGHCIDEWDVMCYSDEPFTPKMQTLCKDGSQDFRLDCNNDDYFAAKPRPGSYLARHWNSARSRFLTEGPDAPCADARAEPDDAYWFWFWDAPMIAIDAGKREPLAFCQEPGDTDWRVFKAQPGKTYRIETTDLAPDVDTRIVLYRAFNEQGWDDMGKVATNDNRAEGDRSSAIVFTSPGKSSYLIGVSEANKRAGPDRTYTLSVTETAPPGAPRLSVTPAREVPGGNIDITMSGLPDDAAVRFWLVRDGRAVLLGTDKADNTGDIREEFDLPANLSSGAYKLEAQAADGSAAATSFTVLKPGGSKGKKRR